MYEKFEKLCEKNGVSAYRVSKETGITTATLTCWKQGKYEPKLDKLQKISDYFGVPIGYFTEESSVGIDRGNNYSIFDKQDIVKISDEAKEVAMIYDHLPPEVRKSIRTLLKFSEQHS